VITWSVRAASPTPPVEQVSRLPAALNAPSQGSRRLYDARSAGFTDAAVVEREAMAPGARIAGPAVIVESETTTIVTAAYDAVMQSDGCLLVQRKE
jgi:N-methylhydantoinase A